MHMYCLSMIKGTISHVMCGFNYFDPHGHEAGTQSLHSIQIFGDKANMRLIGYDWGNQRSRAR
jgi:hypothetical protein